MLGGQPWLVIESQDFPIFLKIISEKSPTYIDS